MQKLLRVFIASTATLLAASILTARLHAQQPDLPALLRDLAEQAAALEHSLPSFTCIETASSLELRGTKVHRRVDYTATLRVRRAPSESSKDGPAGTLDESTTFITVDGKPFTGGGFSMPAFTEGGFSHALSFFAPERQPCLHYTLTPHPTGSRIDFETVPAPFAIAGCKLDGIRGFALIDAEGNVTHIERRVSPEASVARHLVPFAAIDLAPVTLNGTTFQLSHHLLSERPNNDRYHQIARFEADYTHCKLFTATVTFGPATEATPP